MTDGASCGACEAAARRYRDRFGWPCTVDGFAVWTLAGQALDALDIPAGLGPATLAILRSETGMPYPVIVVPGEPAGYWRFLVAPRRAIPRDWIRAAARHGAVCRHTADRIELPPTRVPHGTLSWRSVPVAELPPLPTVLAALARAAP